ncbi:MAG TPA: ATP-binding protein [Polyangium sp.]|nr:ATP-binding protein [Polyangium sp.]
MDPAVASLEELLQAESAWVEWKEAGDRLAIVKTLVAFANDENDQGRGGHVICGVEEQKDEHGVVRPNVVGLSQGERTGLKQKVLESCANDVSPPLTVTVREVPMQDEPGRAVVIFFVAASDHVHEHQTKEGSKVWGRRDSSTREIKREALRQLRLRKGEIPPVLDRPAYKRAVLQYADLSDIHKAAFEDFHREVELRRPVDDYFKPGEPMDASSPPLCVSQEIAPGQKAVIPTNLAMLLFGHMPTQFFPGAFAIVSVYPGTARTTPYSVKHKLTGPLVKVIHDVMDKLKAQMGIFMDKSRSALEIRQNRQQYSETAVQEVVMNAFAHRDYENHDPIRVTVFADRIEVVSPGGLLRQADADKIRAGVSVGAHWRNKGLASFLERMRLGVQAEGQGIPTIFEKTKATAERAPEYEIDATEVKVTIPAYHPQAPPAKPSPPIPTNTELKDGIILISIGGSSLRSSVEPWLARLGLSSADIIADVSLKEYVESIPDAWSETANKVYQAVAQCVDDRNYSHLHLFYRGPNIIGPVIGAAIANIKPLVVYSYFESRYERAYTLDRRLQRHSKS